MVNATSSNGGYNVGQDDPEGTNVSLITVAHVP